MTNEYTSTWKEVRHNTTMPSGYGHRLGKHTNGHTDERHIFSSLNKTKGRHTLTLLCNCSSNFEHEGTSNNEQMRT